MYSTAERKVLAGVLSLGVKGIRIIETAWVTIGRSVEDHDRGSGTDSGVANGRGYSGQSEVALDRRFEPQALLDEVRQQASVRT